MAITLPTIQPRTDRLQHITWAGRMDEADRDGQTRQQFARYYMTRLGIG